MNRPSEETHPYRKEFLRQLAESTADLLDEGAELPFSPVVIDLGIDRAIVKGAIRIARRDRQPILAWLLRRQLARMVVSR